MKIEEEVKRPPEASLAKDGKLIVEYKGNRYELRKVDGTGFYGFYGQNEAIAHELNLSYSRIKVDEQIKSWETMAYWYPRPYSIGKKGAESLGAKIIEHEDEVYNQWDDEGNPIFY